MNSLIVCLFCLLATSAILAINTDRITSCRNQQNTYDSCIKSKLLSNSINMYSIQAQCTARCFPSYTTPAPVNTAYDTCLTNAVMQCVNQQINPLGISLQGVQAPQHTWDLRQISSASSDCQTCIRSVIGQTMTVETLRTAQCLAYDECNAASTTSITASETCTTQSRQLYDAECVCRRDQISTIQRTCQQSSNAAQQWNSFNQQVYLPNIRLCDSSENQYAFRPMSCSSNSAAFGGNGNVNFGDGPWSNNGNNWQNGNENNWNRWN